MGSSLTTVSRRLLTGIAAISAMAIIATSPAIAQPAESTSKGAEVFQHCAMCHSLAKGTNGIGPSLFGVVGRKAGAEPGFTFTAALKNSGIVWTDDKLKQWVAGPKKMVPGTSMMLFGAIQGEQADDLIAFLKTKK